MPRIPSYPLIEAISGDDLMIIDDVSQQYTTKSVELQSLKGYFNTGQATTTYVDDRVVSDVAFNTDTGVLTLTRTDEVTVTQNLDGRYALTSDVFSGNYNDLTNKPAIPPAYGNDDVDSHLNKPETPTDGHVLSLSGGAYTWVAQSGGGGGTNLTATHTATNVTINSDTGTNGQINAATSQFAGVMTAADKTTLDNLNSGGVTSIIAGDGISIDPAEGTGNVTITAGTAQASTWQIFYRKFTGSELRDAFNGNSTDKITLVSVPANKVCVLGIELTEFLDFSTGTTDYADNGRNLAVFPDTSAGFQYATSISVKTLSVYQSSYPFGIKFKTTTTNYYQSAPTGADIILAPESLPVNITAGDRDFILTFTYRIIDLS